MIQINFKKDLQRVVDAIVPRYRISEREKDIEDLVKALLSLEDTSIIHSPISGIYYIFNTSLGYTIRFNKYDINVSNHDFSFREGLSDKFADLLEGILNEELEKLITSLEEEVFENRKHLISKMITKIQYKQQVQQKNKISDGQ